MPDKPYRTVFAALLLVAAPRELQVRSDDVSLSVTFRSISELRGWLDAAGLDTPDLLAGEHDGEMDGRPYRAMNAYPTWYGWKIYAHAIDFLDSPTLDDDTRDRLTAVACGGAM